MRPGLPAPGARGAPAPAWALLLLPEEPVHDLAGSSRAAHPVLLQIALVPGPVAEGARQGLEIADVAGDHVEFQAGAAPARQDVGRSDPRGQGPGVGEGHRILAADPPQV